jgi:transcriptional regulator with XRE-family HTH domain
METKKKQQASINMMKQIREALGWDQIKMAQHLGVAISTLSECENGKREMRLTFRQSVKLCRLLKSRLGYDVLDDEDFDLSEQKHLHFFTKRA